MKCPKCQAENDAGAKFCTECGASLQQGAMNATGAAKLATNTGFTFGPAARKARISEMVDPNAIISARAYNGVIVGVLLWGLLVNFLLCKYAADFAERLNPWVLIIGYLVLAISGMVIASKSHKPGISFLGYNMVAVPFGLIISVIVKHYGGLESDVVMHAFLYTLLISVGMMALVMIVPQFFAKLGGVLAGALLGAVLCEIMLLIFHVDQSFMDWIIAVIFSLYIGYDIYRSQQYPKTVDNAVDSALDIYMDMANLFIRLLEILGKKDD